MKVNVELELIVRLIESIENMKVIHKQDEETQKLWNEVINITLNAAKYSISQFKVLNGYSSESNELGHHHPSADKTGYV